MHAEPPLSITVSKDGKQVFHACAGRLGIQSSAVFEFLAFASGMIGAPYAVVQDAEKRLRELGFQTSFAYA